MGGRLSFVFVGLNALSYRFRLMDVIEEEGRGTPGTIYFPVSFCPPHRLPLALGGRAASVARSLRHGVRDAAPPSWGDAGVGTGSGSEREQEHRGNSVHVPRVLRVHSSGNLAP